jgi:hypothetical protein
MDFTVILITIVTHLGMIDTNSLATGRTGYQVLLTDDIPTDLTS